MFFFNLCLASFWQKQRGILTIIFCPSGGLTITHSLEFNCHCVCEEKKTWSPLLGLEQCRMNSHRRSRLVEIIIWGFTFLRNWLEVTGWMNVAIFLSKIHELDDMTLGNRPSIFIDEIWGLLLESKMSGWRSWSCNSTYRFSVFLWEKNRGRHGSLCPFKNHQKPAPGPPPTWAPPWWFLQMNWFVSPNR